MENDSTKDNGLTLADDQRGLFKEKDAATDGKTKESQGSEDSQASNVSKGQQSSKEEPQSPATGQPKGELEQLQLELEKAQKAAKEHKRMAHAAGSKLGRLKKEVSERLVTSGDLDQEEVASLFRDIDERMGTSSAEEEDESGSGANTFYADILKKVAKELPTVKKYTKDEKLQNKLNAFIFFADHGSDKEKEELAYELDELRDDPAELTRRVLEIGEFHRDEYFGEIEEAGGLPSYVKKNREEKKRLQKTIDKLKESNAIYDQDGSQKILSSGSNKDAARDIHAILSRQ